MEVIPNLVSVITFRPHLMRFEAVVRGEICLFDGRASLGDGDSEAFRDGGLALGLEDGDGAVEAAVEEVKFKVRLVVVEAVSQARLAGRVVHSVCWIVIVPHRDAGGGWNAKSKWDEVPIPPTLWHIISSYSYPSRPLRLPASGRIAFGTKSVTRSFKLQLSRFTIWN